MLPINKIIPFQDDFTLSRTLIGALSILALSSIVLFEFGLSLLLEGDRTLVAWGVVFIAVLSEMITTAMIALTWADLVLRKRKSKRDALAVAGT